jgi:hypothetical protein
MIRRALLLLLFGAALSVGGAAAWAHWGATVNPGANGAAVAASVNAATTPTASLVATQKVTLTWPAVTLTNGVPVDGYIVKRYNATTLVAQTVLAGCAGTVTGTTCTESPVPIGSWRYAVYPLIAANWVGTESGQTPALAVTAPTLTLAKTYFGAPLPTATTGTISGFGVNEAVSYRLDSSTPLTGFPTAVDTTGGAPISSLTIPAGTSEGTHTVSAIGAAGSIASTTITVDTVAPTISSSVLPAPNGAGWNNSSPVAVTLTAADATSGVATVKYTTDGTDPSSSGTAVVYSGPFAVSTTQTVRYYVVDNAGNASAIGSRTVQIDTVAPANSLTLTSVTGARLSGSTIYYRGVATGSFTLTNAVTDAGSGPASSSTAALSGTSTGFTHTASTISTPAAGPYVSNAFTWTAATTSAPTETVTGADVAGNTTATALSLVNDSTAPSGGSVDGTGLTGTGGRYSTSTAISVAFAKGTDSGVGLATTGFLLQRATATLTAGTCGTYGGYTTIVTDPATSPYADTVTDQACYRYQYVAADLLGNSGTYSGGDVKVDTTAPSAPSLASSALTNTYLSGTNLYYRAAAGSGSITLTASSADAASAVLSYAFPAFGTNWTSTAGSTGVNTYSFSSSPAAPGSKSVVATNNAGLTASTTLSVADDSVAPTGSAPTYTSGYVNSLSVAVTIPTGADSGSGLSVSGGVLQRKSAPLSAGVCGTYTSFATIATGPASPYTDTGVRSTCYQYQYTYADNVGNTQTYTSSTVLKVPKYLTCAEAAGPTPGDGAEEYYRLAEATGTVANDSSGRTPARNGAYNGAVNLGTIGVCGSGFSETSAAAGYVSTPTAFTNPTSYSEEVWFKTATTGATTGRLIGFGQNQTGASVNYDRQVWMASDGRIYFGTFGVFLIVAGTYNIIPAQGTGPTYNDAQWHHVVAMQGSSGMKLFIDGVLTASNTSSNTQNYTGYWRVGWDKLFGWNSQGNTDYFNGSLSNAAFYSTELSTTAVYDHWIAGAISAGASLPPPASISFSVQSAGKRPAPSPSPVRSPVPPATVAPSTTGTPGKPKRSLFTSSEPPPSSWSSGSWPSF